MIKEKIREESGRLGNIGNSRDFRDILFGGVGEKEFTFYLKLKEKFGEEIAEKIVVREMLFDYLDYTPTEKGKALHNAIMPGNAAICYVMAGRQSTKTYTTAKQCVFQGAFRPHEGNPYNDIVVIAPRKDLTENIFKYIWNDVVERKCYGVEIKDKAKAAKTIVTPWGSRFMCKTVNDSVNLRGITGDFIALDEGAFIKDRISGASGFGMILSYIHPIISAHGQACITSTPDGQNWFFQAWKKYLNDPSGINRSFYWTIFDNPYLKPGYAKQIEKEAKDWGLYDIFKAEYLADPSASTLAIYPTLKPRLDDNTPYHEQHTKIEPNVPLDFGLDWGFNPNPTAIVISQLVENKFLRIHEAIELKNLDHADIAALLWSKINEYKALGAGDYNFIFPDPTNNSAISTCRRAGLRMWTNQSKKEEYKISKREFGHDMTRGFINREFDGIPALTIDPRKAHNLVLALMSYQNKKDFTEDKVDKTNNHLPDALRYLVVGLHMSRLGLPSFMEEKYGHKPRQRH